MVKRVLVGVTALAVLLGGGLVLPASVSAATRSSISISAHVYLSEPPLFGKGPSSRPTAVPGEEVVVSGSVTRSSGRVVVLQRLVAGAWREVARRPVTGTTWRFSTVAGAPARYPYRALALRTRTADGATSATRVVTVVRPTVSVSAATAVEAGRVVTFTGTAAPTRPGHRIQLWELRGPRWVAVADTEQSPTGTFTLGQRAAALGRHTYRVVTEAGNSRFDVRSRSRDVTTVRASTTAARAVYLAGVSPAGLVTRDSYRVQPVTVAGHAYAKSIVTVDSRLTWQLGAGAANISTALALLPVRTRDPLPRYDGPRLVEVRVDAALRLRRFITPGQVVPLTLDLRGRHTLTLRSVDRGPFDLDFGAAVVLVSPAVSTVPRPERGADAGTALSELRPVATVGPVRTDQLLGSTLSRLFGGSLELDSHASPTSLAATVDYDLGGPFTSLTGVALITGDSSAQTTGRVRIYGDGALLATIEGDLDQRTDTVDVTGVRRLRVELVTDPTPRMWTFSWGIGLGDPRLR